MASVQFIREDQFQAAVAVAAKKKRPSIEVIGKDEFEAAGRKRKRIHPPVKMVEAVSSVIDHPRKFHGPAGYEMQEVVGEGGFGTVHRGRNLATGELVAIKKIKIDPQVNLSSLPEIQLLLRCKGRRNIVHLKDYCRDDRDPGVAYIVMEYAAYDLTNLVHKWCSVFSSFSESYTRFVMRQLLQGIFNLHSLGIVHCDIKSANTLIVNRGSCTLVRICDLGLATNIASTTSMLPLEDVRRHDQPPFGTLWYSAPELLRLDSHEYSAAIDIWAAGCVMGELLCGGKPLFPGNNVNQQLGLIYQQPFKMLRQKFPESILSMKGFDLLKRMLHPSPKHRISAEDAMNHPWFS